jgi:putative transposase
MPNAVQRLLHVLSAATERELARHVQHLKNENRVLRARLPEYIKTTPAERARLLKHGRPVGPAINQLITIVTPGTFHRWVREAQGKKRQKVSQTGRPKKPLDIKKLILRIARDTGWGYTRVLGELRKLTKQKISRQTVANIMREAGLEPGPKRGEKTWDEFVKMHAHTLWQCDFFAKRAWTLRGLRYLYVLVFLNVATRKVFVSKATEHPNSQWVIERSGEFCRHAQDNQLGVDLVFHDADRKFSKAFRESLRNRGLRPRKLHPRSPNLNAYVERWIQSIQVECLDHFIVLGEAHLNHLVGEFVAHYHEERPHQGLDNKLIVPGRPPPDDESIPRLRQVVCRQRLGGLLKHFERRAA